MKSGKFSFLKIDRVIIKGFSLYKKNGKLTIINEDIDTGVFCLAGANGLGKTTFLNILNYGLTGIVLEPSKNPSSPQEIVKSNKGYTSRYFRGRIDASDHDTAEVELYLSLNEKIIRISRSFFDRNSLNTFEIYKYDGEKGKKLISSTSLSPKQMLQNYEQLIASEMGIGTFDNFIFYQLYVLTFDENRRMIFWDDEASTNTLSLAFNEDLNDAERILQLKEKMSGLESYGRNTRWQATQLKSERENLIALRKQQELTNYDELKKEYDRIISSIDKKEKVHDNIEVEYDTLLKRQNILNSELLQKRTSYNQLFSLYSEPRSKIVDNKYVKFSLSKNECFVCGAEGNHISENIQRKVHQLTCPLCDTKINENIDSNQAELMNKLQVLDQEIHEVSNALEKVIIETESKQVEFEKIENELNFEKQRLSKFQKNHDSFKFELTGDEPIDKLLNDYEKRFRELDQKSKSFYKQRDKLRPEYDNLIEKISNSYNNAIQYFVPLFKEIARSFIGLELNITLKRTGRFIKLQFELLGTARTESTQLSESQRFFLDIALRMALVIYLSKNSSPGTLMIDTPEGSLDIAYENRVGKMFANFARKYGQYIIMTANINASQLLLSLAEECGAEYMEFKRMLEWTDLSIIQMEGEHLFTQVFNSIESALNQN